MRPLVMETHDGGTRRKEILGLPFEIFYVKGARVMGFSLREIQLRLKLRFNRGEAWR